MTSILERNKKLNIQKKSRAEHAEDALYREVWEDVNNEKTTAFVKKYYKPIMSVAIGLVVIVAAIGFYRNYTAANRVAAAGAYEAAISSGDVGALTAIGRDGFGATSDLALFQAWMISNDNELLRELAAGGNTRDYRDLAKIHLAAIDGDNMNATDFEKFMSSVLTKSSPYYYTATLLVAQKYLAENNTEHANKFLDKIITDTNAPAVISASASALR